MSDLLSPVRSPVRSRAASPTGTDSAAVRDLLATMKATLGTLDQTFAALHQQSERVASLGPVMDSASQIKSLRKQLRAQDQRQEARIADVKSIVRDVLKDRIAEHMRAQIADQIRTEIALQVRAQVQEQLPVHVPVSLEIATAESRKQLAEVRCSLANSEARRANSSLRSTSLSEPLAPVLRPDGALSPLFPRDLKSLFAYDANTSRQLVTEFELPESDNRERNINKFLSHIGIQFSLIPVGASDMAGNALGITLG